MTVEKKSLSGTNTLLKIISAGVINLSIINNYRLITKGDDTIAISFFSPHNVSIAQAGLFVKSFFRISIHRGRHSRRNRG